MIKTYICKFDTNYEEACIILNTNKGIDYAKEKFMELGAWDTLNVNELNTTDDVFSTSNYGHDHTNTKLSSIKTKQDEPIN